jgi:tRNA A-37 threonylcarbamoyl transferase component Bud32
MRSVMGQIMDVPECRQTGEVRWQVMPEWEQTLLGPAGLRLEEWLAEGSARIVKNGAHRTVYRVDVAGRAFFLKHYRCQAALEVSRHLVRASASRREWRKALEVARRQIPTFKPVALGEQFRGGLVHDSFLVTEAVPDSCSLEHYAANVLPRLPARQQAMTRRKIAAALAKLCAAAHRAGILHNDFHAGNILVRLDSGSADPRQPDGLPRLYLIDLPGVRLSGPLDWKRSRDSLVMLGAGWLQRTTRTERWRFWRLYLSQRPDLVIADPRGAAAEIHRLAREFGRSIARGRDKRSLETNRDYYRLRLPEGTGHAVRGFSESDLAWLIRDPGALLRDNIHRPAKIGHTSVVVEAELPLNGACVRVAYKRCRAGTVRKNVARFFLPSRALAGWRLGHALLERGIATARPIVVCQPRGLQAGRDSYLATEWIEGGENLHLFAWRLARRNPPDRARPVACCARSLGRLLGRMHAWRIGHRDLKGCNLAVVEQGDGIATYLLDMDGVSILRTIGDRRRARDLARLAVSLEIHPWVTRADRLRFVRAYLREFAQDVSDWKRLWRAVSNETRTLLGKMRRQGKSPA